MQCNCPKTSCERHGDCEACRRYHENGKREPYCLRKKRKPRALFIAGIAVIAVALTATVGILAGAHIVRNQYRYVSELSIGSVDIGSLQDGVYTGRYTYGKNVYTAEVTVLDRCITKINLHTADRESNRPYIRMAEGIIDEVIAAQTLQVDTVSGATRSSKAILKAVELALCDTED